MDIVGIDIAKARFDAALLAGERVRPSAFSNTEAGFEQFLAWLMRHRADPSRPLRACLEATGNWGLDLADFLHTHGVQVGIVNLSPHQGLWCQRTRAQQDRSAPHPDEPARRGPQATRP